VVVVRVLAALPATRVLPVLVVRRTHSTHL
jgi:hypothetical protein